MAGAGWRVERCDPEQSATDWHGLRVLGKRDIERRLLHRSLMGPPELDEGGNKSPGGRSAHDLNTCQRPGGVLSSAAPPAVIYRRNGRARVDRIQGLGRAGGQL